MDRADAMRSRLHVIRAAAPTVFRYCCARGMKIQPAAPAKKLQRFETLRLLWRRDSVCSEGYQMTHGHRRAQRYDGHDQIQIAVAIYVRVRNFFAGVAYKIIQAAPRQPSATFGYVPRNKPPRG